MTKKHVQRTFAVIVFPLLLLGGIEFFFNSRSAPQSAIDSVYLLVPDNVTSSNPVVAEWLNAANEEGLHLSLLHDSELLSPLQKSHSIKGIIVPDMIHQAANGALVGALHEYVRQGGNLMIVYDACTWDLDNRFTKIRSRMSDLVGVSYAMYERYRTDLIHWSSVWGDRDAMADLGIPPGKFMAVDSSQRRKLRAAALTSEAGDLEPQRGQFVLSRYEYGDLSYPAFRTQDEFDGKILLRSSGGVAAGIRQDNLGHVLFVNLPLSYLGGRTDGLLLHSFLRYFEVKLLDLPYLASVPDGVGGLVFNWHIDAKAMAEPLHRLMSAGIFDRGPYSIHFTAGPDDDQPGDGKGLNIGHDERVDRLITDLQRRGHVIGSHGGWIHNYFGEHVSESNEKEFAPYLQWNLDAIQKVTGKPVTEYSAPLGNQPTWVSPWLEAKKIHAYYFAGDTGMGPTQVFRDDKRDGESMWAFPIVHLGRYASLEEMGFADIDGSVIEQWLDSVSDFVSDDRTARLLYTHPLGATKYIGVLQAVLKHTDQLQREHRFQWYTMAGLADFMNQRKKVQWSVQKHDNDRAVLRAKSSENLNHMTWLFPKDQYQEPKLRRGQAQISSDNDQWVVTAGDCKDVSVEFTRKQNL